MKTYCLLLLFFLIEAQSTYSQVYPIETREEWESYFDSRDDLDPIEGIWSVNLTSKVYNYSRFIEKLEQPQLTNFVIFKSGNHFQVCLENGGNLAMEEIGAEYIYTITNSGADGVYFGNFYHKPSGTTAKANVILKSNGILEYTYENPTQQYIQECKKLRTYDRYQEGDRLVFEYILVRAYKPRVKEKVIPKSRYGTGFAISTNGIVATNYHVIEGAQKIKVKGANSDFNTIYDAKVLVSDKVNDLALIQIEKCAFAPIPYTIKPNSINTGEGIFVLGYPLRATMGDEIKLTTGVLSSKTGFQGDVTTYQVSAPVQPGNSGGPLFDSHGNLIGVISSKHLDAENVSYGIKSSYLLNLIDLLPTPPVLPALNQLNGKTLSKQVQMANKYVVIIEAE